jgi:hypothetical protein
MSSLEHVNFAINGKYSKTIMTIMHASLVIFQTYKNEILRRVDSFGWLL